jgi:hypothetical protein
MKGNLQEAHMSKIKNILFLSLFFIIQGCGGSNGGSDSSNTNTTPTPNPTVTLTNYQSDTTYQQQSKSINVLKLVVSDINNAEVTRVRFRVSTQGGYDGFSFNLNNITIDGNIATSIDDDVLIFDKNFQSFSNNEWILNVDSIIEEFKHLGGSIELSDIHVSIKDSTNNEYTRDTDSFILTIEKSPDFSSVEFIQHGPQVNKETLIAQIKAESDIALCEGSLDLYFGEYNPELSGSMYNPNIPDNLLPEITAVDLSMIESITVVNNISKEEHIFYDIESMISLPVDITSHDNRLDFSVYATKAQGISLTNIGILQNLKGFGDCNNGNVLHQNRWKYLENSVSFYDSYLEMTRMTLDQSGTVEDQIEKRIEDYVLNVLKCETCLGEIILHNITYRYKSTNVDVSTSSINFFVDGQPLYEGLITLDENDKFVFSPEVILSGESNLEVSVVMNVLDINQTAKFGVYPETFSFTIVETGETIILNYGPGEAYVD